MAIPLTDTAIAKATKEAARTGKRHDLIDAKQAGLRLRLTPSGVKSWVLACRDRFGRMRRFPLGAYPTLSIAVAREKARTTHHAVKFEGADPIADRRRDRQIGAAAKLGHGTLKALLDLYEEAEGGKSTSWPEARTQIARVFKAAMSLPLPAVTLGSLQTMADQFPSKSCASVAVRRIKPVLKWGSAPGRKYVARELAELTAPKANPARDRTLSRDELAAVLPVLHKSERPQAAAMWFMLVTLARREEVGAMVWRDVNLETGICTFSHTKNRKPHSIKLPRQAVAFLLKRRPKDSRPDAFVFCTRSGGRLGSWDLESKRIFVESGTSGWTRHDLRRTGTTMLGNMGVLPDVLEAALNHSAIHSALAATYNKARYQPEVAAALQLLADTLDGIQSGGAEIVSMKRRPG